MSAEVATSMSHWEAKKLGGSRQRHGFPRVCGGLRALTVAGSLLALILAGCLVPQDDHILPNLGSLLNHPPRIAEEAMPVSRFLTAHTNSACLTTSVSFPAVVDEPDLGDDTHWRLYVDWNPLTNPLPFAANLFPGANNTQELRSIPATPFTIPVTASTPLGTVGTHVVELWVTDGPADNISSRRPALHGADLPDGGTVQQYFVATYPWVVTVRGDCL